MTDQPDRPPPDEETFLVPLLVVMAVVTGVVDAVSFLHLGHVFVANMTGNVIFLGFAVAGSSGFSWSAALVALAAFLAGAVVAGRLTAPSRRTMLARCATSEAALCVAAAVVSVVADGTSARYAMTVLLALAMGGQNATARRLAVRELTTTAVLTTTLTGLAVDPMDFRAVDSSSARRIVLVLAMFTGAAIGALLVVHASPSWALGTAALLLAVVALAARRG